MAVRFFALTDRHALIRRAANTRNVIPASAVCSKSRELNAMSEWRAPLIFWFLIISIFGLFLFAFLPSYSLDDDLRQRSGVIDWRDLFTIEEIEWVCIVFQYNETTEEVSRHLPGFENFVEPIFLHENTFALVAIDGLNRRSETRIGSTASMRALYGTGCVPARDGNSKIVVIRSVDTFRVLCFGPESERNEICR